MRENLRDQSSPGRKFVPSLMLSFFSTNIMDLLANLLLLDVTLTFFGSKEAIYVAITSQLATISSVLSVIIGILLAFLSVRFNHRSLLLSGTICIPIGVIGCILAPNFLAMQIFFPLDGMGSIIVGSMAFSLVGEHLPLSGKTKSIGWIVSGATWARFIGAILIRYIFPSGDWRLFLTWFALPVSMFAFFFVYFGVPSSPPRHKDSNGTIDYIRSFKEVFFNISAMACLVGNMMRFAANVWVVFNATFFRIQYDLSLPTVALITIGATLILAIGNISGGQIVNKVGRKRLLIVSYVLAGVFLAVTVYSPDVWIAAASFFLGTLAGGTGMAGSLNLVVEQVPKYRGIVMSMSSVFVQFGAAIGAAVGGAVLALSSSYQNLALTFVAFNFAAVAIYLLFAKDPCRN